MHGLVWDRKEHTLGYLSYVIYVCKVGDGYNIPWVQPAAAQRTTSLTYMYSVLSYSKQSPSVVLFSGMHINLISKLVLQKQSGVAEQ